MGSDTSRAGRLIGLRTFEQLGFTVLFVGYLVLAIVVIDDPLIGYPGLLFILGLWLFYPVMSRTRELRIPATTLLLAFGLTAAVGTSALFWQANSDLKDVVGLYTFFIIVPLLYLAAYRSIDNLGTHVHYALQVAFFGTSVIVLADILINGFSFYRSQIIGLNKNGVSFFFEVIYCYLLFNSRNGSGWWTATVIGVGLTTLFFIFSKTAIGFGVVFTLGYFSSVLFVLSLVLIGVIGVSIMLFFDRSSLLVLGTAIDRLLLWTDALEEITRSWTRFFFGYGPGQYVSDVHQYALADKKNIHNYFLQIAHGFGAITLAVIVSYFFWIFRQFGVLASGPVAAFWIFNLHATFDVGWVTGQGFLASLTLGMILARNLPGSSRESTSAPTARSSTGRTGET
jgi:hypothetical protein